MQGKDNRCDHRWRPGGLWDGKTSRGRTGGLMYRCAVCGEKAFSKQEIKEKGGSLEEGYNIFGKPMPDHSKSR